MISTSMLRKTMTLLGEGYLKEILTSNANFDF